MRYVHAHIKKELLVNTNITIFINFFQEKTQEIKIFIEKGRVQSHLNIPIYYPEEYSGYNVMGPWEITSNCEIVVTKSRVMTKKQEETNKEYGVVTERKKETFISYSYKEGSGDGLLVTFPGFVNVGGDLQYPLTVVKDINSNKLIFQDDYLVNGTYMLCDDTGIKLDEYIIDKIAEIIEKKTICESKIVFFGVSKGGTIALRIGSAFPNAKIVAVVPQLDLTTFYKDTYIYGNYHKHILGKHLEHYGISTNIYSALEKIVGSNQKATIWIGERDYYSNSDTMVETETLKIMQYNGGHNEVINKCRESYLNDIKVGLNMKTTAYYSYTLNYKGEKYMNIDFHYAKEKENTQEIIILEGPKKLYKMFPPNGTDLTGKIYNCILNQKTKEYSVLTTLDKADFSINFSNQRQYTEVEKQRDVKNNIVVEDKDGVKLYFYEKKVKKAQKLLITFPGFYYHYNEEQYLISILKDCDSENLAKLCFQDNYFIEGTYMLADDEGRLLKDAIENKIRELMVHYGIMDEDVIFFGASKGGTIALSLLDKFNGSRFIAIVPQISIDHYREHRPHLNGTLLSYFDWKKIDYSKLLDLELIIENSLANRDNDIYIVSGKEDHVSSNLRYLTNDRLQKINLLQVNLPHNSITNFVKPIWAHLIMNHEIIDVCFVLKNLSLSNKEFEVYEYGNEIKETEYNEVLSIVEVEDVLTGETVFSTPIAKIKSKDNRISSFVNSPISGYMGNYVDYLHNREYYFKLKVYSVYGRMYVGYVVNEQKNKYIYSKIQNKFL